MNLTRSLALALSLAAASAASAAQTGAFEHGELLMRSPTGLGDLYRIDPLTGATSVLWADIYQYVVPGWIEYDPSRDALLAYCGWQPAGLFAPRLWAVSSDGSVLDLGFDGLDVQKLAPVGDGRVYCTTSAGLQLIDGTNAMSPVPDHNGVPFDPPLNHMHYHAPTNSLIGVSANNGSAPCYAFRHVSVLRLPLTPNGKALSGPVTCTNFDVESSAWPIGIDPLPGGDLLVTMNGASPFTDRVFLRVDPFTLSTTLWGESTLNDVDGGVWNDELSRVVVFDDVSNVLKTFAPGQSDGGTVLAVSASLGDSTTGISPHEHMIDLELAPGGCGGSVTAFGDRLAGTGGVEPRLGVSGCPTIGAPLAVFVVDGLGQTGGVLAIGAATATFPLLGGEFHVLPPFLAQVPFGTGGSAGAAGGGGAVLPLPTPPNGNLVGVPFYAQVGLVDAGAPQGFSLTNAVEFVLGN